tara:strand:+ start:293 stop:502 length:210 start_codon:yes stop_codon:yes gene_type:complete
VPANSLLENASLESILAIGNKTTEHLFVYLDEFERAKLAPVFLLHLVVFETFSAVWQSSQKLPLVGFRF